MSIEEAKKVFNEAICCKKEPGDGPIRLSKECRQAIEEWGDQLLEEKPKRMGINGKT